jgi:hypothetical protein
MRTLLLAGGLALLCAPGSASSQTSDVSDEGAYDIACPATLNSYFHGDYPPAGAVPGGGLAPVLQIWLPRQTRPQPTPPVRRG